MKNNTLQKNIRKDWQSFKLGDLGKTYAGIMGKDKDDFGSGKPFITYMNIYSSSRVDPDKCGRVKIDDGENQNKAKYGDLFFTTSSETPEEVGVSSVLLDKNINDLYLNSFCFGFRLNNFKTLSPEFAQFYFRGQVFRKQMTRIAQGASRYNLSKKYFLDTPIDIPTDIAEQGRIVCVLETWDRAVEKLANKIKIKKSIKKCLTKNLLTGKVRLAGFKGEWESIKLGDAATFRRGSFPQPYGLSKWYDDENGAPFIQVFDVGSNMKLKKNTKRKISIEAQKMSVFVPKESIVLTIQGSIGRIALTSYDAFVDRTLLIFRSFKIPTNKVFFMYTVFLLFQIEKMKADGGTIKTITKETLNQFKIKMPSIKEQNAIADILVISDKEIEVLEKKLRHLKDQKRYLLNNLITGTIRTKA